MALVSATTSCRVIFGLPRTHRWRRPSCAGRAARGRAGKPATAPSKGSRACRALAAPVGVRTRARTERLEGLERDRDSLLERAMPVLRPKG